MKTKTLIVLALLALTTACQKEEMLPSGSCYHNSYTAADTEFLLSKPDNELRGLAEVVGIGKCTVDHEAYKHFDNGCGEAIVYDCNQLIKAQCDIRADLYVGILRALITSGKCFQ
jgi:hypothetical protein